MALITTFPALLAALSGHTVAQCGFDRHEKDRMHQGHIDVIAAANSVADISLVTFYPHTNITNYLTSQNVPIPPWKPTDKNYCVDFCTTNGADIVFIPDISDIITAFHLNEIAVPDFLILIDGIISANDYYHPAFNTTIRYYVGFEYQRNLFSVYPKNYSVYSNKDGYSIYTRKHYLSSLGVSFITVPKAIRPDGLPYSNRLVGATTDDLAILKQMYDAILVLSWAEAYDLDLETFRTTLNAFDTKPTKTVTIPINTGDFYPNMYKWVGRHLEHPNDVMIEVIVNINGTTEMLSNLFLGV